jgi:glucose-1-phosphate thymidylyltransferase
VKALVLSGGFGTRLRPLTHTRSKHLLPLANRPILHHVLDKISESGLKEVVIVLGSNGNEIRNSVGDGFSWDLSITYVEQSLPLGLAHAVKTARPILDEEPFVMFLGDNILPEGFRPYLRYFIEENPEALVLLHPVENPSAYGIALVKDNKVLQLCEKPTSPPSNLALIGVYFFTPEIHWAIDQIKPSARGELEITDAIQNLLERGKKVEAQIIKGPWYDTGTTKDLLDANQMLLTDLCPEIHGQVDPSTTISGSVSIGPESSLIDSRIIGPVLIGNNCRIANAYIGPYTSIGNGVYLEGASIERSIILDQCQIKNTPLMFESIIGVGTKISKTTCHTSCIQLHCADHTKLWL